MSGGFALYETDNPAALYAGAAKWADLLEFHSTIVIEDEKQARACTALRRQGLISSC